MHRITDMDQIAKFFVGQIVHHRLFDYRGVVYDADPLFQGTDEWYEAVARSRPSKHQPWYHVLVDRATHTTYVAEQHLEQDSLSKPVQHPLLEEVFRAFEGGRYTPKGWVQ